MNEKVYISKDNQSLAHKITLPALLISVCCYKSQPHLAMAQVWMRLAGNKLSWENT